MMKRYDRIRTQDENEEPTAIWLNPAHIAAIYVNEDFHTVVVLGNGLTFLLNADAEDMAEGRV